MNQSQTLYPIISIASLVIPPSNMGRIKFENDREEIKALEVLLDVDCEMRWYKDDVYGLSEEQISLLDRHKVKYNRI